MPDTRFPTSYSGIRSLAFGREGLPALPVDHSAPLPVRPLPCPRPTYRSGVVGFAPAAAATDIATFFPTNYGRVAYIEQITISGTASSAAVLDLLIQRSVNGGGGTMAAQPTAKLDARDRAPTIGFYTFSANRSSNGNGIDGTRPLIAAAKLHLGTATTPGQPVTFCFQGTKRPMLRDLTEWVVINLNGQTLPVGISLDIHVEWSEEALAPIQIAGDSTTSNAITLWEQIGNSGAVTALGNIFNAGSNGYRLYDALTNSNGIPYPLVGPNGVLSRLNGMPGVLVLCYGLNDLRQGLVTRAELISMIDAAIYATINGTTSGASYVSPLGAGTSFTWPTTLPANPDCRILLWSPNPLASDGNSSNYVTLTGRFAAMTLAQAAQTITDDLYAAYDAFAADPRVWRVVHKQDLFGRSAVPLATSGLMTDILHPNARGQVLSARQIVPHLYDAIAGLQPLIV